jgi:hypothetical protein
MSDCLMKQMGSRRLLLVARAGRRHPANWPAKFLVSRVLVGGVRLVYPPSGASLLCLWHSLIFLFFNLFLSCLRSEAYVPCGYGVNVENQKNP